MILVVGNDGQFAKLCEVFGRPEWVSDERFATNAQRVRNIGELSAMLRDLFGEWERERLIAALDAAGVPCGAINTVADVFKDPQVKARGMLQPRAASERRRRAAGVQPDALQPTRRCRRRPPPPLLGQHSDEILAELGYRRRRHRGAAHRRSHLKPLRLQATGAPTMDDFIYVDGEGLNTESAYRLIIGCVTPRPVAWITTVSADGRVNAAPFSSYNYVATSPPMVAVNIAMRAGVIKDTARNIRETGEFVINVATEATLELMHSCGEDYAPARQRDRRAGHRTAR